MLACPCACVPQAPAAGGRPGGPGSLPTRRLRAPIRARRASPQIHIAHRGDAALAGKLPALTRSAAEAHLACGQLEEAEAALTDLLRQHPSPAAALLAGGAASAAGGGSAPVTPTGAAGAAAAAALGAAAGAAAGGATSTADAPAAGGLDPEERLSLLCLLADVQLKEDTAAMEARVSARIARRLQEAGGDASAVRAAARGARGGAVPFPTRLPHPLLSCTPTPRPCITPPP